MFADTRSAAAARVRQVIATKAPTYCECGNEKPRAWSACTRCKFLDGSTERTSAIIWTLRGTDGMSLTELAAHVCPPDMSWADSHRSLLRTMQHLVAVGRCRRYWHEDTAPGLARRFGREVEGKPVGCWRYALNG